MKNLIIGFLLAVFPVYSFFSWIYIFNKYSSQNQQLRQENYNDLFLGISTSGSLFLVVNIAFLISAILFLLKFKHSEALSIKMIGSISAFILVLILLYNFWALL